MRRNLAARNAAALALVAIALVALPFFAGNYFVSVGVLFLLAAYLGQAWNIMMGFCGQLSLGHALYLGLGAYVAAAFYVHWGTLPWLGMIAGIAVAGAAAAAIAALSFRFGVTGVYFALITIAFNEFTRILFDHFDWVRGTAGLYLPVATLNRVDLLHLRGGPVMFYYVMLALTAAAFWLSRALLHSRAGLYWLAIREDQEAARAVGVDLFRYKLAAVTLSAAMTAVAGTVTAFYYNDLYPDDLFTTARSVEIITAPIVGGIGTLFGPILGAFVLTVLGEALTSLSAVVGIPGMKQWFYGAALVVMVLLQPAGLWPWLARILRLGAANKA